VLRRRLARLASPAEDLLDLLERGEGRLLAEHLTTRDVEPRRAAEPRGLSVRRVRGA
jgi:hypothetical protein